MKVLKLAFSRFSIVFLAIVLQIVAFYAYSNWLSNEYYWVRWAFTVLGVIVFLVVINKDKPASFKLPWATVLLLVPILGTILYAAFGNVAMSPKNRKRLEKSKTELQEFCQVNELTMIDLEERDALAYGQAKYISNTSNLPTYNNCYNKFLPTGEEFFHELLIQLSNAKKYIFMEYFIVEYGFMWDSIHEILLQKVKEGVEVYLMYDDVGSIGKVKKYFFKALKKEGIHACKFSPFIPFVSVAHNNRDHRKITVIDGEVGFVGGANIADEYINKKELYGKWKDNAVLLKGKCVDSLIFLFLTLYNFSSKEKLEAKNYVLNEHRVYDDCGFLAPYSDGPCPSFNDYIGKNVYLNIINQAKKYLYITTPYLILDYETFEAIENAAKRGVDVRLILPHVPDKRTVYIMSKSNYLSLIKSGVKIFEYAPGFIHAKMFVCDDEIATVGTINLDYRSLVHHFECGVWLYKTDCIKDMKKDFDDLFSNYTISINERDAKLKFHQRLVKDVLRLFAPLM